VIEDGMRWDRKSFVSPRLESLRGRITMRFRTLSILAAIIALAAVVQSARAGAIRFAAKQLHKGSITAIQKTSDAKGTAVGSVEDAGRTAHTALKSGTSVARADVASAPGAAIRGTKTAAGKIWKAVW
jgi:hypothetical protein